MRDIARAYWIALDKAPPGEVYNVGSGRTWSIREMLDILLSHSSAKIRTQEDPARLRPSDVPILWADVTKFRRATGWEPHIPFERSLGDLTTGQTTARRLSARWAARSEHRARPAPCAKLRVGLACPKT